MNRAVLYSSLLVCLFGSGGLVAAQSPASQARPPAKRTIFQTADVAESPRQETMLGMVEIPVGAGNPKHMHNGTEMGVVLEGQLRQIVDGQPTRVLGPGDSFLIPRGVPHQSILIGNKPVKLISSWTVDKGGQLMVPAN